MKENKSIALKGNGGITLIALVITIIVLIILAGISIAMISGQDGIISKAGQGAAVNQIGAAKDKCALLAAESVNDVYDQVYVKNAAVASDINALIDQTLREKIVGAKGEIVKVLGGTGSAALEVHLSDKSSANLVESTALSTDNTKSVGGTIKLTYSDGTFVYGTINETDGQKPGVITWGNINENIS